ncbi:MAG: methionine--tRNA ligase [Candidatus Omnitrophota bacterium]
MAKFYITTPIYYINAKPHLGHSYTNIAADCISRYKRQLGYDCFFLTGTDEHGQKVAEAAKFANKTPQEFADDTVTVFKDLWKTLLISCDDFIRTTQDRHRDCVKKILNTLHDNGDIYKASYNGWYCVPCETFWTDSQLVARYCPDCKRPIEKIQEQNYFFKLSKYQDWLLEFIKEHPDFICPRSRYNEVLKFLESEKLLDLCISRPKSRISWGIVFPFDEDMVTYVWFDALINYISALGFGRRDESKMKRFWPADIHLMAKDILRQHAIYWPIMLKALNLPLPKKVFAHGWWMVEAGDLSAEGVKMSKSRGNVVDPLDLVEQFGIDAYRYFLLREFPFGLDGRFSLRALIKRYNSDLANDLGNLVYRTLTMIEKYFKGKIPKADLEDFTLKNAKGLIEEIDKIDSKIDESMEGLAFTSALDAIWHLINGANKFIEEVKPWQLYKNKDLKDLAKFIVLLVQILKKVSFHIGPFMPNTSVSIIQQLGDSEVKKGEPLFPRIQT